MSGLVGIVAVCIGEYRGIYNCRRKRIGKNPGFLGPEMYFDQPISILFYNGFLLLILRNLIYHFLTLKLVACTINVYVFQNWISRKHSSNIAF